jgi:hypothetical protein
MYSFSEDAVITGATSTVWQVASDVAEWPSWDPHEQKARFEGDFLTGAKGWSKPAGAPPGTFTITAVEPERMWASEAGSCSAACAARTATSRSPMGRSGSASESRCTGRSVRADTHKSFAALEAAWLSRGARASQATRSAEMSRPAIPNRAAPDQPGFLAPPCAGLAAGVRPAAAPAELDPDAVYAAGIRRLAGRDVRPAANPAGSGRSRRR